MAGGKAKQRRGGAAGGGGGGAAAREAAEAAPAPRTPAATPPTAHGAGAKGVTDEGVEFRVPPMTNVVTAFRDVRNWNAASVATLALCLAMVYFTLRGSLPVAVHVAVFFFWRLCYNVGLGAILDGQSKRRWVTRWYERAVLGAPEGSVLRRSMLYIVNSKLPAGKRSEEYPPALGAWLVYRSLVDLVLLNDALNYVLLAYKLFEAPPNGVGPWEVLQYAIGAGLWFFNYWAKVDAHRCIGDYCWYWGDFFFRKEQNLTFDGIFELFPHPMYSVGYALYYGTSLITRSYELLIVSLVAHCMQLAFLVAVEEPHIERTYGSSQPKPDASTYQMLYDPKAGLFPGRHATVLVWHLDGFRAADFSLVALVAYAAAAAYFLPFWAVVLQAVVWRLAHWVGLGAALWNQSRREWWTRHFLRRGRTLHEAFNNWKRVYNTVLTMCVVSFAVAAVRAASESGAFGALLSGGVTLRGVALGALGLVMVAINVWSSLSTFEVLGDFGWFYGDFFVPPQSYRQNLVYTGIYRFLNNPDCVTGHAGFYGAALLVQSWPLFWVALGSQLLNVLFVKYVESPHMRKLYPDRIRAEGPISRELKGNIKGLLPLPEDTVDEAEAKLKARAQRVKLKALEEVYKIYRQIDDARKNISGAPPSPSAGPADPAGKKKKKQKSRAAAAAAAAGQQWAELEAPKSVRQGEEFVVGFSTTEDHQESDWIGIYECDVPTLPGRSNGRWVYVPPGAEGQVEFHYGVLPGSVGAYELRYHRGYDVLATSLIKVVGANGEVASPPASPRGGK